MDGKGKGEKKWRRNLADLLELPREIILNLPRITVVGNIQCCLENHRGVIQYTSEKVRVSVNGGEIIVEGQELSIRYLGNEEIAIDGSIDIIRYEF
ncbi:sporulation protein YqfC [Dethiobacter alkaliphilus]|uniref:Sporulation protein YqfC n=1 Tax=Dethiobacter alkaliphilus AHT 1 TaxID=555088 RepID=C0GEK2_DETAL|nr:sporulation protein YqfC [Dethiobacter alkaliphilus]EEG78034.1 sporulation protein YqfC [Dethiobacter alkaliphilus AHT 1]MCW3489337.1 sporulation protein YqfC [Dethiobacter alkaliphilus]